MSSPFVHRLRVRYSECDPQGNVFNANFFMYFDVALTELWREAIGSYGEMMQDGVDMVVAEARARYLAAARFDDELDVEMSVTHLGTTSMVTAIDVRREDQLLVQGEMRHVFVDTETMRKTAIPENVRRALAPQLAASGA